MRDRMALTTVLLGLSVLGACAPASDSPPRFALPAGHVAAGPEVFVAMRCGACHAVEAETQGGAEASVVNRSDAALVTSIIHSTHASAAAPDSARAETLGALRMSNYNDSLTVTELVDLVAYLRTLSAFETRTEKGFLP